MNKQKSILHPVDFFSTPDEKEKNSGKKVVVSGQSMSPRELMSRFENGDVIPVGRSVYHDTDDEGSPFLDPTRDKDFDLSDQDRISSEILKRRKLKEAEDEAKRAEAERREAEKQKAQS